jgi:hypothetical protein
MSSVGFEPTISACERPQTYALDRASTGTGLKTLYPNKINIPNSNGPLDAAVNLQAERKIFYTFLRLITTHRVSNTLMQDWKCVVFPHEHCRNKLPTPRSSRSVIRNLGNAYLQGYEPGHLGVREKKLNNGRKSPLSGYLSTVTKYRFEITATILITIILLI